MSLCGLVYYTGFPASLIAYEWYQMMTYCWGYGIVVGSISSLEPLVSDYFSYGAPIRCTDTWSAWVKDHVKKYVISWKESIIVTHDFHGVHASGHATTRIIVFLETWALYLSCNCRKRNGNDNIIHGGSLQIEFV